MTVAGRTDSKSPPPPCCSPPLVVPRRGGGGLGDRHLVNTKFFVAAHCCVGDCVVCLRLPSLLPRRQNHHPRVLPKAFQWKVESMCKSSR